MNKDLEYIIVCHIDFVVEMHDIWYHGCRYDEIEDIIYRFYKELYRYRDFMENLNYISFEFFKYPDFELTMEGIDRENHLPSFFHKKCKAYYKDYETINYCCCYRKYFRFNGGSFC